MNLRLAHTSVKMQIRWYSMTKLHLGCGWRNFGNDWIHIDGGDYEHLDHNDITKLPYKDETVDVIYASHVLEYFDREEAVEVLAEWTRVLKKGGVLRIAVPDFEAMAIIYVMNKNTINKVGLKSFLGPLYGKMTMGDQTIYHKTTYDFDELSSVLESVGIQNVARYDWRNTEHSEFDDHSQAYIPHMDKENGTLISLNVEGIKAWSPKSYSQVEFYYNNLGATNFARGDSNNHPYELHIDEQKQMNFFLQAITNIERENPSMIELGHSSHSAYSQTFNDIFYGNCTNVAIEPIKEDVETARQYWSKYDLTGHFYHGWAGSEKPPVEAGDKFTVKQLMDKHNIEFLDILHMDIDGSEKCVLSEMADDGVLNKINYMFISTHDHIKNGIHSSCIDILNRNIKDCRVVTVTGAGRDSCLVVKNNKLTKELRGK